MKYNVREKLLNSYFDKNLYEIFSDNSSRICSFNTLLLLLKYNKIELSVLELKNLLIQLYNNNSYNKTFLEKHIFKQKKDNNKDKTMIDTKKIDLNTYILSENYYISMIDLYILLKHFELPFIFVSTTNINIVKKYNFLIGFYNNTSNNYYMIKYLVLITDQKIIS